MEVRFEAGWWGGRLRAKQARGCGGEGGLGPHRVIWPPQHGLPKTLAFVLEEEASDLAFLVLGLKNKLLVPLHSYQRL